MVEIRYEPLSYMMKTGLAGLSLECHSQLEREGFPYNPDWQQYQDREDDQSLGFLAMRDGGDLAGYAVIETNRDAHRKDLRVALIRDVYVTPDRRGHALQFFRFIEKFSLTLGAYRVDVAQRLMGEESARVGRFYALMDYKPRETVWSKILGNDGEA